MYSFAFPDMLNSVSSNLVSEKEAVKSNLMLLLSSEKKSLFGDPYFGSTLVKFIFEQSHSIIVDLVIDELYTAIATFIPQIHVDRKNIKITTDGTDLFASIQATYVLDNTSDLYVINLTATDAYNEK